jgi:hypothetical protein
LYEYLDLEAHRTQPPNLFNSLTEMPRALLEAGSLLTLMPSLSLLPRGDRHPLLLIPGFMAGDGSLGLFKRYLRMMGYEPRTWGYGTNMGRPEHLFDHLPERLLEMADETGQEVSLIGQSLGGVYARELAHQYPDMVRQVITMGSPFGARNGAITMRALSHLFEVSSGKTIDEMVEIMRGRHRNESPDVPVTAIFSKGDGVVHWSSCREMEEDHHTQNIEVAGSHVGMAFNAMIYYIVADRLSQDVDAWQKFAWHSCR